MFLYTFYFLYLNVLKWKCHDSSYISPFYYTFRILIGLIEVAIIHLFPNYDWFIIGDISILSTVNSLSVKLLNL